MILPVLMILLFNKWIFYHYRYRKYISKSTLKSFENDNILVHIKAAEVRMDDDDTVLPTYIIYTLHSFYFADRVTHPQLLMLLFLPELIKFPS